MSLKRLFVILTDTKRRGHTTSGRPHTEAPWPVRMQQEREESSVVKAFVVLLA